MSLQDLPKIGFTELLIITLVSSLVAAFKDILKALVSEVVVKRLVLALLRHLAKQTNNEVDDQVVSDIEHRLYPQPPAQP